MRYSRKLLLPHLCSRRAPVRCPVALSVVQHHHVLRPDAAGYLTESLSAERIK